MIAIAMERATTIVECPSEKKKPTADGALAFLHELAGHVVDRGDMIAVEGMPQTE